MSQSLLSPPISPTQGSLALTAGQLSGRGLARYPTLQTSLVKPVKEGSGERPGPADSTAGRADTGLRNLKTNIGTGKEEAAPGC